MLQHSFLHQISSPRNVLLQGTMLIEMNDKSPHPIALEITQGCPSSDAWLLLRRLNSSPSVNAQTPPRRPMDPRPPMDPIEISP